MAIYSLNAAVTAQDIAIDLNDNKLVSGSDNIYQIEFEFSEEWENFTKKVVFETSYPKRSVIEVLLSGTNICTIPTRSLAYETFLKVGVYGVGTDTRIPTVWSAKIPVLVGTTSGYENPPAPEPDVYQEILDAMAGKADEAEIDDIYEFLGVDPTGVPAGYTKMLCLETAGDAMIDTGRGWQTHPKVIMDVYATGGSLFGELHTSSKRFAGGINRPWYYGTSVIASTATEDYINQRLVFEYSDTFLKINGETISTFDATSVSGSASTFYLFAAKTNSSSLLTSYANRGTRIYSVKVYQGGSLTFYGIPAKRNSDGVFGFYDTVSTTFKTASTGTVTGIEIPNLDTLNTKIEQLNEEVNKGYVTFDDISAYGTDGVFTESFSYVVKSNGDLRNQIFTCVAKYERSEGVTDTPRIRFTLGTGLRGTTQYTIGKEEQYSVNQWRVVKYPTYSADVTVNVTIPEGCTLYIKDFKNEYSDAVNRYSTGLQMVGHRALGATTPNDTLPAAEMGAKAGYAAFIEIPKRTSDGVWIFYHDDTFNISDTDLRNSDGTVISSSEYNGLAFSQIPYSYLESLDWGVSCDAAYAGTKPMTMVQFFKLCAETGMHPALSIHPTPTSEQLGEIKTLARKLGVLNMLEVKGTVNSVPTLYEVFGNDIYSYTLDIASGTKTQSDIESAIAVMDGLTDCTARREIELFASTAYNAYFGTSTYNAFELIAAAGYGCSLAQQTGAYNPTHSQSTVLMWSSDFDWWSQNHGVTRFTFEYNWSNGLNW